ncbi:transcriptional regulator [Streptomyces sp. NBC_00847]|uniref:transcriptional regulator n=1 Tax=unclassified Streptomyces TaxID=2593676 RepID=UPI0022554CB0|nr:transcriptional regulator [Streptomyces sp. NBC_00847]MCX4881264.1 transcriptional regulator [Streptomyces sp. NBC_00847]
MTTVRHAEHPRLPVRDKGAARERAWSGVSPMLTRLAAERATGALVRERGTLHLAEGLVVHAESPYAPGLDVLLTAHGALTPEAWQRALGESDDGRGVGRRLIDDGRLPPGALELCHLTALYDAAYFALAPSSTPGRFRYGSAHRFGPVRPVPVADLEHETLRRRDLLHRIWPDPGTDEVPLIRADPVAAPALTRRQRTVLAAVNGSRTAADIARELGRLAFHTLVDVRRLSAAGVVSARGEPPPPTGFDHLPPDPHITLLKRLRDALEAL